ncbi:MAG: helix-turn-helix domain-containing protein [Thermoguttaceae bacterium]|jgi:hypothetical protein
MRERNLRPDKNGIIWRNLGWKKTRTGQRSQHKFNLGTNKKEAQARFAILKRLWQSLEEREGEKATWTDFALAMGTALASGKTEVEIDRPKLTIERDGVVIESCYRSDADYAREVNSARDRYPFIKIVPAVLEAYQRGVDRLAAEASGNLERLEEEASRHKRVLTELGKPIPGEMLHDALDDYIVWIKAEYFDRAEGHVSDSGMTKIRQVKTIRSYLENVPLAMLDFSGVDRVFGYFRKRPLSKRSGDPMTAKSCRHYIGEIDRFFCWLHLSASYPWRKPQDYEFIRKKPDELEGDVEAATQEIPTYTIDQLAILNEYATPIERVFFLLGVNCAFGSDQSGRLKIREVRLSEDGSSFIRRVRRKKKVKGTHLLFKQTVQAMKWALERRKQQQPEPTPTSFLLLNDRGQPYWRKTKGGNRCRAIPKIWYDLLDRVRVDHPDFPRHGFNTLRDTSSNMIREIAGEEVTSMHLTHKHQSEDRNLGSYSNPPLKRLFRAQRKLELKLQPVFDAAPKEPFAPQMRAYTPRKTVKQIQKMKDEGASVSEIARSVNVARTTVYRHLKESPEAHEEETGGQKGK